MYIVQYDDNPNKMVFSLIMVNYSFWQFFSFFFLLKLGLSSIDESLEEIKRRTNRIPFIACK